MTIIMTKDGRVRPLQASDLKEVAERDDRIRQLEKQCADLAAEVDRQRPVVEAAQVLTRSLRRHQPESWSGTEEALERAVAAYEASREGADGRKPCNCAFGYEPGHQCVNQR